MNLLRRALYRARIWASDMVRYPASIGAADSGNYDEYWDTRRGATLGALSEWQQTRLKLATNALSGQRIESLADVGCGDGAFVLALKDAVSATQAVGYDMSERALEAARKNGVTHAMLLDLRSAAERNALPSVDVIMLFEVLEHLAESETVLDAMYSRAGKAVLFSVPNTGFLTHRFRLLFGKFPLQWSVSPNEHLRFWTLVDMRWWLQQRGYQHAQVIGYRGVPLLNRLWPNLFAAGIFVCIPHTVPHAV